MMLVYSQEVSQKFPTLVMNVNKIKKLLEFLRTHEAVTVAEMKRAIDTKSNRVLYEVLNYLKEEGVIRQEKGRWRSTQIVGSSENKGQSIVPLLGFIAAGQPIEAVQYEEVLNVPKDFLFPGKSYFGLCVKGDSMIDEHILDGDRILLEKTETARNGEIVVAIIDGENATLKKFYQVGNKIILEPANTNFQPIEIDSSRVIIQGVFAGLIRPNKH